MAADNKLLNEFKELIETVSLEVLKEAQTREVAKDVVTRSYKIEIADALEVISGEIERVKQELKDIDYISDDEIKTLVEGICIKQEANIKDSEEHIKSVVNQTSQELYISNEKLRSEVETVGQKLEEELAETKQFVEEKVGDVWEIQRALKESIDTDRITLKKQVKTLFWINYGLIAVVIGLLIFIATRSGYGA